MARRKSEKSKHTKILFRETMERKHKLIEYAKLNHMSLSDYIRDALDIRDNMTRQKFNFKDEIDEYDDYFDEDGEENADDFYE